MEVAFPQYRGGPGEFGSGTEVQGLGSHPGWNRGSSCAGAAVSSALSRGPQQLRAAGVSPDVWGRGRHSAPPPPPPADKAVQLGKGSWRPRGSAGRGWGGAGSGGTQSWPGKRETREGPGAGRADALRPAGGRVELLRRAMDRPLERKSSQRMRTCNRWASWALSPLRALGRA